MRFHSQNLNEKKGGRVGSVLRHGRCWLSFGVDYRGPALRLEWSFPSHFIHAGFEVVDGDDTLMLKFACRLFGFFMGMTLPRLDRWLREKIGGYDGREFTVSVHDGALWWSFWCPTMSWSSRTPRWRHGNFNPIDFIFGRQKYESRNLEVVRAVVPMPEGGYPCTVTVNEDSWKRSHWPRTKRLIRCEVKPDKPIPFPGKGENSYDCGEDASHSLYCCADTPLQAVIKMSESVMRSRLKYGGGWNYKPEAQRASS